MNPKRLFIVALVLFFAWKADAQTINESLFKNLRFRSIGPAVMGGRIDDVAVVESNPAIMYVGSASGGLWKTTNNGTTWEAVFDDGGVGSVGDVAVAPSNPDVVWIGTGEPNNRQSSTYGDGVYKSIDAGKSWQHMGLRDSQNVGRIVIDPKDSNVVYIAALGHLWGPNKERGVFKTTDGGRTWTNVLFINEDTGVSDIAMDSANSEILYAAAYQRRRTAWGFNGGGPGGGLYKSVDAGKTWKKLAGGLPTGTIGRIGLEVYRKNPAVVYATVEHRDGGIFRTDDRGETWRKVTNQNPRPMYYSQIRIDPANENRIYVLGTSLLVSNDGARTFVDPATGRQGQNNSFSPTYDIGVHGDNHAMWIDPANSDHVILGSDGGLYFSYDGSRTWDKINNMPLGQYYSVGVDMQKPYYIYGGLQDVHSWGGPSATHHQIGILNSDWSQMDFGDGMYARVDPTDPATAYVESQGGSVNRVNTKTGDRKSIRPFPPPGEAPYRFNWTAPIEISPFNSRTIYIAGNRVFKSTDRGDTWTAISPDLTKAEDRSKFPIMGMLPAQDMLSRNDGVSAWGTITTFAESTVTAGVLWAGTDDGNLQVSRNSGAAWTNVVDKIPGLPKNSWVSRVEPSHRDAGTAYVSFDRHQADDFNPYVYMTTDYGQTWKSISTGIAEVGWVNVVKEHPKNPNVLIAGTETGVFVSVDRGGNWARLKNNLPTVPVDDIAIHPRENDIILGTHGRSIYVMDDIAALSGLTDQVLRSDAHIFETRPAMVHLLWKQESYSAHRVFAGENPPFGAILNYYLRTAATGDVKLTIAGADGKTIRELPGTKDAGINRVVWDLRYAGPEGVAGGRGPFVAPGTYTVKLSAGGRETSTTLQVESDPQMPVSDAERRARLTFLLRVNDMQSTTQAAATAVDGLNSQINAIAEHVKRIPNAPAAVTSAVNSAAQQIRELQQKIAGAGGFGGGGEEGGGGGGGALRGRLNGLFSEIDGDQPQGPRQGTLQGPSPSQTQRLEQVSKDLETAVSQLNNVITAAIPNLNQLMNRNNIPSLIPVQPVSIKK